MLTRFLPNMAVKADPFGVLVRPMGAYIQNLQRAEGELQRIKGLLNGYVTRVDKVRKDVLSLWKAKGGFAGNQQRRGGLASLETEVARAIQLLPNKRRFKLPNKLNLRYDYRVVADDVSTRTFAIVPRYGGLRTGMRIKRGSHWLASIQVSPGGIATVHGISVFRSGTSITLRSSNGTAVRLSRVPDLDGDGVLDARDACPRRRGPRSSRGCPDRDGDGVADDRDKCITLRGKPPTGCPPMQRCNSSQVAGGNQPVTRVVGVGARQGRVVFRWSMYRARDRMLVSYQGRVLFDTGCVSGAGQRTISFRGQSSAMTVRIQPNCLGRRRSTSWSFSLGCAR